MTHLCFSLFFDCFYNVFDVAFHFKKLTSFEGMGLLLLAVYCVFYISSIRPVHVLMLNQVNLFTVRSPAVISGIRWDEAKRRTGQAFQVLSEKSLVNPSNRRLSLELFCIPNQIGFIFSQLGQNGHSWKEGHQAQLFI